MRKLNISCEELYYAGLDDNKYASNIEMDFVTFEAKVLSLYERYSNEPFFPENSGFLKMAMLFFGSEDFNKYWDEEFYAYLSRPVVRTWSVAVKYTHFAFQYFVYIHPQDDELIELGHEQFGVYAQPADVRFSVATYATLDLFFRNESFRKLIRAYAEMLSEHMHNPTEPMEVIKFID